MQIVRRIAIALDSAHAAGIVHRDIKPENILLDRNGRAYVSDFGIARELTGGTNHTISRQGQIIGTPALMPPEQARGDIHAIDARSDIYALGATMYYKLARRYPFEAENLIDLLHHVMHSEPALPRSYNTSIPGAVEAIIMRCLAKRASDRYQCMADLIEAIDRVMEANVSSAPSATPWFRKMIATRPEAAVDRQSTNGQTISRPLDDDALEVIREIAAWDANLYRITGSIERACARLDDLIKRLDQKLRERPDLAWARFYRGAAHFRYGNFDQAIDDMERAIDRMPDPAGAYFELGRLYLARYLRDHEVAHRHLSVVGVECSLQSLRPGLEQAVIALRQSQRLRGELNSWHREYADAVMRLADGKYQECINLCDRILDREPELEEIWKLRGDAQHLAGEDPLKSYHRAVDIRRSFYDALFALGRACMKRGQLDEARAALERAIMVNPCFTEAMALLARVQFRQAGDDVTLLRGALEIAARARAIDHDCYDAAITLAEIQARLGIAARDDEHLEASIATLMNSRSLPGCQNRVNLLLARGWIEHARLATQNGHAPGSMLDQANGFICHESAHTPDNEPWLAILRDIESLQAQS